MQRKTGGTILGRPESATTTAIPDAVTGRAGELELDPGEITSTNAPEGRCDGLCASAVPENVAMRPHFVMHLLAIAHAGSELDEHQFQARR